MGQRYLFQHKSLKHLMSFAIDTAFCEQIIDADGDYLLPVKKNQAHLFWAIETLFQFDTLSDTQWLVRLMKKDMADLKRGVSNGCLQVDWNCVT